jgi:hypothetical protein
MREGWWVCSPPPALLAALSYMDYRARRSLKGDSFRGFAKKPSEKLKDITTMVLIFLV